MNRFWNSDVELLANAIQKLGPLSSRSIDPGILRPVPVRIIDCVLSLNRNFDRFVVPRVERFQRANPNLQRVAELAEMISNYPCAADFVEDQLQYRHADRARVLKEVVGFVGGVVGRNPDVEEADSLKRWAANASPKDVGALKISGFGISGFQYLRILFGAQTTKPDIWIIRFVSDAVGYPVSAIAAVGLLEAASRKLGVSASDVDATIWERGARGGSCN
jgi:hypothetical protein